MSTIVYLQRSVAFSDSFTYQLPAGTFQTGKIQANFTIRLSKDGTGNQSTAGIAITEVDAVNNPGDYRVSVTAAAFVAANGFYHLIIFDTASPIYSWDSEFGVTDTGLPGPEANVFFTSTAANGRIVDSGGAPVQGATVFVRNAATVLWALTTDAAGNYTFSADAGVYTLYVQKTGYIQASTTVTFTTTVATGPGIDVTLTSMSTGGTVYASELWTYSRQQSFDQLGASSDLKIKRAVNRALDMVAKERTFNWWLQRAFMSINGALPFTITLTKGSAAVIITTATPTWATTPARFNVNSQIVDILSRTDSTHVTLTAVWNGATGNYAATLFQDTYALPDNMFQFGRILPGQKWGWGGDPVSAEIIWERQNLAAYQQQGPGAFAIYNGKMLFGPYPSVDQTYLYTYHRRPTPMTATSDIADFDASQIEITHRAIDYQTAMEFGKVVAGDAPACLRAYKDALARMVTTDRTPSSLPGLNRGLGSSGSPTLWQAPRAP